MLLLLFVMAPVGGTQASAPSGDAVTSAKLPKCKLGKVNKKKCRCPQGYKRRKVKKGFKCVKVKPPEEEKPDDGGDVVPPPDDTEGTDQGGTDEGGSIPTDETGGTDGAQPVRDDAALRDALLGAAMRKSYSGGGYGFYTFNFLPDVQGENNGMTVYSLRYCDFYYAPGFGNSRSYYNGLWAVEEGFRRPDQPQYPGLVTGKIFLYREGMPQDQAVQAAIGVWNGEAALNVGSGSTYFEGGDFSFMPGRASTDCSQWET